MTYLTERRPIFDFSRNFKPRTSETEYNTKRTGKPNRLNRSIDWTILQWTALTKRKHDNQNRKRIAR